MSPHMHGSLSKVRSKVPSYLRTFYLRSKVKLFIINKDRGDV